MKSRLIWIVLQYIIFSLIPVFAVVSSNEENYFQSLTEIQTVPPNSTAVLPCGLDEKKQVLALLTQSKFNPQLHLTSDNLIVNSSLEMFELYKGDFSNEGMTEYALVSTSGSMRANWVTVYKLFNNRLIEANLDNVISKDLLNNGDLGPNFYLYTANPYAIVKNGKTYIRYMSIPYSSYEKSQLMLCTYLWTKNHIVLSAPNLTFSPATGKLINTNQCIGKNEKSI